MRNLLLPSSGRYSRIDVGGSSEVLKVVHEAKWRHIPEEHNRNTSVQNSTLTSTFLGFVRNILTLSSGNYSESR
jgi:hypothetical protein